MRTFTLLLLVGLLAVTCSYLRWHAVLAPYGIFGPQPPRPPDPYARVSPEMRGRLQHPLGPAKFEDGRLQEVIVWLRERSGVPIFVNWLALRSAAVRPDPGPTIQVGPNTTHIDSAPPTMRQASSTVITTLTGLRVSTETPSTEWTPDPLPQRRSNASTIT